MSNVPNLSSNQLIKVLAKFGFKVVRQSGSHIRLEKISGGKKQLITIPNHKTIKKGTLLNGILKPAGISLEELKKAL